MIWRLLFHSSTALGIALSILSYLWLPNRIAVHFGFSGRPDRWASKTEWLVVSLITLGVMWLMFIAIPWITRKVPDEYTNLPNKEYWLRPENKPTFMARFTNSMYIMGFLTQALIITIGFVAYRAQSAQAGKVSLNSSLMVTILLVYTALLIVETIRMVRSFKLPKDV